MLFIKETTWIYLLSFYILKYLTKEIFSCLYDQFQLDVTQSLASMSSTPLPDCGAISIDRGAQLKH